MKNKNLKYYASLLFLTSNLVLTSCSTNIATEESVLIEDEELEESIEEVDEETKLRENFDMRVGNSDIIDTKEFMSINKINIAYNQMEDLYSLECSNGEDNFQINLLYNDEDLINYMVNHTDCSDISLQYVKDTRILETLDQCEKIKSITLYDCDFNSLELLSKFTNLETLVIYNCEHIRNIKALESLEKLTYIVINGTSITDVSPLAKLSNLKNLNLRCNKINNPEVLASLENINDIRLEYNDIQEATQLDFLVEKEILTSGQVISIIESTNRHTLVFSIDNYDQDGTILEITYYKALGNYYAEVRNEDNEILAFSLIDDALGLYDITENLNNCLSLRVNNLPDTQDLKSITNEDNIQLLMISHCDFDNLSFLNDYKNIITLQIDTCPNLESALPDRRLLTGHDNLANVIIRNTSLKSIDFLANTESIKIIELSYNDMTTFELLTELPNLKYAKLTIDNYPADAESLYELRDNGIILDVIGYYIEPLEETQSLKK